MTQEFRSRNLCKSTAAIFVYRREPKSQVHNQTHRAIVQIKILKVSAQGLGGDAIRLSQCKVKGKTREQRWLPFGHIVQSTRMFFWETHLGVVRNDYARFRPNSSTGYGRDAITEKTSRWPMAAMFVCEPEPKLHMYNQTTRGTFQTSFKTIQPVVLEEML